MLKVKNFSSIGFLFFFIFIFLVEFQPMMSTLDDSSLLLDQDTSQFFV